MGNDVNLASCFHENAEIIYLYITIKPCNFASGNFISHTGKQGYEKRRMIMKMIFLQPPFSYSSSLFLVCFCCLSYDI